MVFQRRNAKSNCCLLSAPIAFCVLLFVIQMVVNRLLLGREDFKVMRYPWPRVLCYPHGDHYRLHEAAHTAAWPPRQQLPCA